MRALICTLAALLVCLLATPICATVFVKTDGSDLQDGLSWATAKRTIQAGINAAFANPAGDEVWVKMGTYSQRITLKSKVFVYGGFDGTETLLSQRNWVTNVTIIDGSLRGTVVYAKNVTNIPHVVAAAIDGFTIRNGKATYGGGVYCKDSLVSIANNIVTANTATYDGGGIYGLRGELTIESNTITGNNAYARGGGIKLSGVVATIEDNTITLNTSATGGGMSLEYQTTGTVQFNEITDNSGRTGGGVVVAWRSSPSVMDNYITDNTATNAPGVYIYYSTPLFMSNQVSGNVGTGYGGGYLIAGYAVPTIINDTVVANEADNGGGFCVQYKSTPVIVNTIIALNAADTSGGAVYYDGGSAPAFSYCDFYSNGGSPFFPLAFNPVGSDNNIDDDPLFVNAATGDYHLQGTSTLINAGNDAVIQPGWLDLDGNARIQGTHVDMGCFEDAP